MDTLILEQEVIPASKKAVRGSVLRDRILAKLAERPQWVLSALVAALATDPNKIGERPSYIYNRIRALDGQDLHIRHIGTTNWVVSATARDLVAAPRKIVIEGTIHPPAKGRKKPVLVLPNFEPNQIPRQPVNVHLTYYLCHE